VLACFMHACIVTMWLGVLVLLIAAVQVKCRGGCGEEYCSAGCEREAWGRYHCLLCPVGAAPEPSSSSR
jgi:hypothetical protein